MNHRGGEGIGRWVAGGPVAAGWDVGGYRARKELSSCSQDFRVGLPKVTAMGCPCCHSKPGPVCLCSQGHQHPVCGSTVLGFSA